MSHLGPIIAAAMMSIGAILGIVRPEIILDWAKQAHPGFRGDGAPLLSIVRWIGIGGLVIVMLFVAIIARSFWS